MLEAVQAGLSARVVAPARSAVRSTTPAWLRSFVRRKEGTTAIEFGIVLLPFMSILLMTMETALVFFAQQTLETAVADSARLIMTGQAQSASFDADKFKTAVCGKIVALFDCANGMYVDVQKYTSFASITSTVTVDSSGKPVTTYQPGANGDIVVVRLIYKWPIVSPLTQTYLADSSSTTRMLVATAAFRNEPF
ncbi:MAG: pilus assembly protein [Rhodoplanes sp.]|uniref:TadE/TadG family type IV pilus assembly protein n=1 Tax=Rhodoplanes sp. TaxID=1968906 RepID=UPI001823B7BE|nr:TadE/TadG family type IV pilus assembly protein [Rhodoplanes sp.]NVO14191.1 pilus assembly protein [Rhodoplanes sp.]